MTDIRFFQVGGCVRDGLLGVKTKDIDFAVQAPSFEAMAEAVVARCTKVFTDNNGFVGEKYFTIRGIDPNLGAVDFVLCRKDGPSTDGRRPDFVEPGTIWDDLSRRDFTVNAMALTDDGELLDPHGGKDDLDKRLLRFVGEPSDRLAEDALRAFRALRFSITKELVMTFETRRAIQNLQPADFDAVATDRIRDELTKMFAKDTTMTLDLLVSHHADLLDLAFSRGIWLKPTNEDP